MVDDDYGEIDLDDETAERLEYSHCLNDIKCCIDDAIDCAEHMGYVSDVHFLQELYEQLITYFSGDNDYDRSF